MIQQENIHYLISDSIYIALVIDKEKELRYSLVHSSSNLGSNYDSTRTWKGSIYYLISGSIWLQSWLYLLLASTWKIDTSIYIWVTTMIQEGRWEIESRLYSWLTRRRNLDTLYYIWIPIWVLTMIRRKREVESRLH